MACSFQLAPPVVRSLEEEEEFLRDDEVAFLPAALFFEVEVFFDVDVVFFLVVAVVLALVVLFFRAASISTGTAIRMTITSIQTTARQRLRECFILDSVIFP